jgi:hypothetical protein
LAACAGCSSSPGDATDAGVDEVPGFGTEAVTGHCDLRWSHFGDKPGDERGARVAAVGDLDGDGASDLVVSARFAQGTNTLDLFSGRTGALIAQLEVPGELAGDFHHVGDADQDGVDDLAVAVYAGSAVPGTGDDGGTIGGGGEPRFELLLFSVAKKIALATIASPSGGPLFGNTVQAVAGPAGEPALLVNTLGSAALGQIGRLDIVALPSGALLRSLQTPSFATFAFGQAAGYGADVSGDGVGDLIVGDPAGAGFLGTVAALSGADESVLWSVEGGDAELMGDRLIVAPYGASQNLPSVVVGVHNHQLSAAGAAVGRLLALDGSGAVRWTVDGRREGEMLGHALAWTGDLDGDGVPDVIAGAPNPEQGDTLVYGLPGRFMIISGRIGETIADVQTLTLHEHQQSDRFGWQVVDVGDVDGDGRSEVAVSAPYAGKVLDNGQAELQLDKRGYVSVWSCRP